MKFEIDIGDLFLEEGSSSSTVNEAIKNAVVDRIITNSLGNIENGILEKIELAFSDLIKSRVEEILKPIGDSFLDHEYKEKSAWGKELSTWTLRGKISDEIAKTCEFKKQNDYCSSSQNNLFTKKILECVDAKLSGFKQEFAAQVDKELTTKAMQFALDHMKSRLK